jgi:hypothetical protein
MAYVLDITKQARTDGATVDNITFDDWFVASDVKAGDYIMVAAINNAGLATPFTITSATGAWTRLDGIDAPRISTTFRAQIWWFKYNGTTFVTAPTIGGGAVNSWAAAAWVVRDAPDVADQSWIDVTARTDVTSLVRVLTIPSVTTTQNNCLLLTVSANGSSVAAFPTPDRFWGVDFNIARVSDNETLASSNLRIIASSRAAYTAGATPTYDYVDGFAAGNRAQLWTIAIKNKTGGVLPVNVTNPPTRVTDYYENNAFPVGGFTQLSAVLPTIAGQPTFAAATTAISSIQGLLTSNPPTLDWFRRISLTPPTATTGVSGVRWDLPAPANYTTGLWCLFFQQATLSTNDISGAYHYFEDNLGNWAVYQPVNRLTANNYIMLVRYLPDEVSVDQSATPPNLANITKRGIAYRQIASSTTARTIHFRSECIQPFTTPLTLTGGGSANPITARTLAKMLQSGAGYRLAFAQGNGQQVVTMPYQLGNGIVTTYVDDEAQSLEYPRVGGIAGYAVSTGRQEIRLKASVSDTIMLDAGIKGTATPQNFIIDSTSDTGATYGMSGTFLGWNPTFKSGLVLRNGSYIGCGKIDAKGANVSGSKIKSSISTNAAMRIENGCIVNGSDFTKGAETYAIEINGTGTVNLVNTVFTGYVKPLNVLATIGTVTIQIAADQTPPAYDTAGATVVFDQPIIQSTASVEWTQTGSSVQVYNVTTSTEIYAATNIAGTSWSLSYTPPASFDVGDSVRVRIRKAGYEPIEATAIVGSTGWSVFGDQIADSRYSASTPANYSLDYVNKKIRATGARDAFLAQEIVDIVRQGETTLDGIRLPEFAAVSGLVTLSPGVSTALTVELDLWQLSWAAGSVSQATVGGGNVVGGISGDPVEDVVGGPQVTVNLSAAATQVSVGSGVLPTDITAIAAAVWNATLASYQAVGSTGEALDAASAGGSGGGATAQQVWEYATRTLTASSDPSAATIATAVRSELSTELGRIDVAVSTRNATAPDNAGIAAIKAKTDNLPADPASNTQVNTRLASAAYTAPDNATIGTINTKVQTLQNADLSGVATQASVNALGTPLQASSYTAPDNAGIAAIKAKTDNLPSNPASRDQLIVVNDGVKKASLLVPHSDDLPA